MEKINTYAEFWTGNVKLNISTTKKLKGVKGNMQNWGYFEITDGSIGGKDCWWDNLEYFINCGKKEFKQECKKELKEAGFDWREVYKDVKRVVKRAIDLGLLVEEPYVEIKDHESLKERLEQINKQSYGV
jgi:hypothetical protein